MDRTGRKNKKRHRTKEPRMERTQLDNEIVKYLRHKVPKKSTTMQKQAVDYFIGSKAVDALMESKWSQRQKGAKQSQIFVVREDAARYLNELLQKRFFYRALKTEKGPKNKDKDKEEEQDDSEKSRTDQDENKANEMLENKLRKRKVKKSDEAENEKAADSESNKTKGKTKGKAKEKKSKDKIKKRYKLTPHMDQLFFDSKDIYIWLYNPVSWKTFIMGVGVLLMVVAGTLFPLWPPQVRVGVYYLSLGGGIFIGSVFGVALARTILYGLIWVFTWGKHELWILPNILADVGFFESFKPWYTYEYKGSKDDDEEEQDDEEEEEEEGQDSDQEAEEKHEEKDSENVEENVGQTRHSQSSHDSDNGSPSDQ